MRPIFENLNKNCSKLVLGQGKYAVDESMISYYGRHSSKQYIRGKPIRYGFKVTIMSIFIAFILFRKQKCVTQS